MCYKMCLSPSLLILYLCDTHFCLFHFLWVSPHCPRAFLIPHCSFFPVRVLRDCLAVVPVSCSSFTTSVSSAAEVNVSLCYSLRGWGPYLPAFPLTRFFPCCWAQKNLEWKGRLASNLINGNLITFLPTWNSQTMIFTPTCQPKNEIYRKI